MLIFIFTMTTAVTCCCLSNIKRRSPVYGLTRCFFFVFFFFLTISSLGSGKITVLESSQSLVFSETVQTNQMLLGEAHHQSDYTGLAGTTTIISSRIDVQTGSPTKK